jgi:hypothetical protein
MGRCHKERRAKLALWKDRTWADLEGEGVHTQEAAKIQGAL